MPANGFNRLNPARHSARGTGMRKTASRTNKPGRVDKGTNGLSTGGKQGRRHRQPENGGGGWIRTSVRSRGQIYSLVPLTTRPPLHRVPSGRDLTGLSESCKKQSQLAERHVMPRQIKRPPQNRSADYSDEDSHAQHLQTDRLHPPLQACRSKRFRLDLGAPRGARCSGQQASRNP